MKLKRVLFSMLVGTLVLSSCDAQIMEWKDKDNNVTVADIPLELEEILANYDYIKTYVQQYASHMTIGLGLGADLYTSDDAYKTVADANFQMFTTGNAMKHSSVVTNSGSLSFTTIDAFMDVVPADIQIYGHNFIWHTQQNQTYLKSLIAPEVQVEVSDDDESTDATTRSNGITYVFKTAEEKREILLNAMEEWIKGMIEHCETNYPGKVVAWDVINEPIDDNSGWRGFDNNFADGDSEPVEDPTSGLSLNWESNHFYWGYYIGKDYGVKAFEFARQYAPAETKLFVNDYNLETNPSKLNALIDFINYIDENNATGQPLVDGIGTQMHVTASSITQEEVDAMFITMAATGKLIRVTELDVSVGTTSPTTEQLATQAEVYQMIFDSYRENVPEAQQSGITIWGLSDNAAEHTYWLPDDSPNIFDANYERKHAYKGVCDGIAGKDISEDFSGEDWMTAYEEEDSEE